MNIPGLRGLPVGVLAASAFRQFSRHDMSTYASALAYQVLFSLFPFFVFLVSLISYFPLPGVIAWLREQAQLLLPAQAMDQVNKVLDQLQVPQGGLLSVGAIVALWSASAGARATMNALNKAYGVRETRRAWKVYAVSVLYTFAIAAMLIVSATLLLVGPRAMELVASYVGFEYFFVTLWAWLRWPLSIILFSFSVAVVYFSAPAGQKGFPVLTPGAVLAVAAWIAGSLAFDYYVSNFGNYNAMYGSIGAIIVLLLYFYISCAVLLLGAEVNAAIERHAPRGRIESRIASLL